MRDARQGHDDRGTRRALDVVVMEGIKTNAPLHRRIMDHPDFLAGKLDTHFMERLLPSRKPAAAAS